MNDSHSPPPRPSHDRPAASSSSHRINNASSDPAEPCGEGDGDNLLRDLVGAKVAADKGYVCINECNASFIFSREEPPSLAASLHLAGTWPPETCLLLKEFCDVNAAANDEMTQSESGAG